ncbi:MAG: archease [Nitrospirae bacterium]|nr:archease [Nitrospirota bacterium]MBI3352684.1 archease [Nitrospirota bacterium]
MNSDLFSPFKIIDTTADIGLIAFGTSLMALFENAGKGLFSLIADLNRVEPRFTYPVHSKASGLKVQDPEGLLVEWLNELIYIHQTRNVLGKICHLTSIELELRGYFLGEPIDWSKHELKFDIKAATFHRLYIKKTASSLYEGQVIFDI